MGGGMVQWLMKVSPDAESTPFHRLTAASQGAAACLPDSFRGSAVLPSSTVFRWISGECGCLRGKRSPGVRRSAVGEYIMWWSVVRGDISMSIRYRLGCSLLLLLHEGLDTATVAV